MKRKNRKVEEVEEGFYDKTPFLLFFFDFFDFAVKAVPVSRMASVSSAFLQWQAGC
jgi:hypothetical protein